MWRAFFLSIGIFLVILGVESLAVEKVTTKFHDPPPAKSTPFEEQAKKGPKKILTPPPWVPWILMSSGVVVCLYSFTLPRRVKGG